MPALVEVIRQRIAQAGPQPFHWFMEQALYHPEHGYYSSGRARLGRSGDYFTNVSVGPLFGQLLLRQFEEMWERLGRPAEFMVVEQGAHGGDFARDVLEAAAEVPELREALRYVIVEPFPRLRDRQKETLHGRAVTWRASVAELDQIVGAYFSNELFDSLPVHLVEVDMGGEWRELFVGNNDAGFSFVTVDSPTWTGSINPATATALASLPKDLPRGYRTEVNLAAPELMEAVAAKLARGWILTVDYGYSREEYYGPSRTRGTLQCRRGHKVLENPLIGVGETDLTARVDWTSLAGAGLRAGLDLAGFTDQHHFITGLLREDAIAPMNTRALQTLLHPQFLGTNFQYLGLSRGVNPHPPLRGFSFAREGCRALGL